MRNYAFDAATVEMEIDEKVKLLAADRQQRAATEQELRAALTACTKN